MAADPPLFAQAFSTLSGAASRAIRLLAAVRIAAFGRLAGEPAGPRNLRENPAVLDPPGKPVVELPACTVPQQPEDAHLRPQPQPLQAQSVLPTLPIQPLHPSAVPVRDRIVRPEQGQLLLAQHADSHAPVVKRVAAKMPVDDLPHSIASDEARPLPPGATKLGPAQDAQQLGPQASLHANILAPVLEHQAGKESQGQDAVLLLHILAHPLPPQQQVMAVANPARQEGRLRSKRAGLVLPRRRMHQGPLPISQVRRHLEMGVRVAPVAVRGGQRAEHLHGVREQVRVLVGRVQQPHGPGEQLCVQLAIGIPTASQEAKRLGRPCGGAAADVRAHQLAGPWVRGLASYGIAAWAIARVRIAVLLQRHTEASDPAGELWSSPTRSQRAGGVAGGSQDLRISS
eukprot:scaffold1340_cov253-Pinguiococcus_pyrenoidosus.AAC.12